MSTATPAPTPTLSPADMAAHDLASCVRPASVPGHLLVDHDAGLGVGAALMPLSAVRVGERVTATADITGLQVFPGRVRVVLDDRHGGCADVLVPSPRFMAASRSLGRPIEVGDRVQLHGTVVRRAEWMPQAIDAYAIRTVSS
ncbi:hypothetical protein U9R90_05280 [Streptomyces sp. E11-3]|uniref:hypothetical protein n=1 Tax=Streptomyces sp. E11-3 TaxID=3110112 RepID=UPI00398116C5